MSFSSRQAGLLLFMLSITKICQVEKMIAMSKPEILQVGPYPEWDQIPLDELFSMHKLFEVDDADAFLQEVGPRIQGIATRGEMGADRAMIEACPNLKIVSVYGVGYDAVDLEACKENGVRVTNTPDVLTKDVADFGVAMMLAHSRGIMGGENWARSGQWAKEGLFPLTSRVWGKSVGILGLGRIGFEVGKRLASFDMEINYSDISAKDYAPDWNFVADPVELARKSDFLFVTLAASAATRHIVGKDVIEALGPQGMIVNVSRASNIDEAALLDALDSGALGAAALDVFEGEPNFDERFLALPNVMLQPHQASGTVETRKAMGKLVRDNLAAHFEGQDLLTAVL